MAGRPNQRQGWGGGWASDELPRRTLSGTDAAVGALLVASFGLALIWYVGKSLTPFDELSADFLMFLLTVLVLLPAYLIVVAVFLYRRQWRTAFVCALAPIVGLLPVMLAMKAGFTPTWVHWQFVSGAYAQKVAQLPVAADGHKLASFHVGTTGGSALSMGVMHFFVYDDTGEIGQPSAGRSPGWRARAMDLKNGGDLIEAGPADVTRLGGRFYHLRVSE